MDDDQQFCLRWNNHQSTLIQNFDTLLERGTLVDCTLAAEGKYLMAHKVVLSACSPYFEGLLSEHYDKHPVFILKDVKFKELEAMMNYMYRGEVNISQDQLTALLKAAESLQIKGLSDSKTGGSSTTTTGKSESTRSAKTASSTTSGVSSGSVDIPHTSSGLSMEKINKVPRQSLQQVSVSDLPDDSASPQLRGISSREGSQSPSRKRKRIRRRSVNDDTSQSMENHEASNSSDVLSAPSMGAATIAEDKTHADPAEPISRSALMQQLTKQPADEMLQIPLEKPEPSEEMIQPKSEYVDDQESVEDLTHLDDDMNDLNEMEDNSRAGPSHDPSQHSGIAPWHISGDRSSGSVVTGAAPGAQDDAFLVAHEAAQAQRDSQGLCAHVMINKMNNKIGEKRPILRLKQISQEDVIRQKSLKNNFQNESVCPKKTQQPILRQRSTRVGHLPSKLENFCVDVLSRHRKPKVSNGILNKEEETCENLESPSLSNKNHIARQKNKTTSKSLIQSKKSTLRVLHCPNEGCTAIFYHRTTLNKHVYSECKIKANYKCGFCNYKCSFPVKIRYHIFKVHGTNEFKIVELAKTRKIPITKKMKKKRLNDNKK